MTVHGRYPGHHGFSLAAEKYIGDKADSDLYSKWIDILKNNKNVRDFLVKNSTDPKYSWRYNPIGDLTKFRLESLPELDCHIYLYDVLRRQRADIFLAMARNSFGMSDLSVGAGSTNESHSIEVIDAMLRLNEHLSEEHGALRGQVREAMYALQLKEMPDIYKRIEKYTSKICREGKIVFSRDTYHHEMLEREIASYDGLGKYLKTQVPEGGIFPVDPLTLHYYDRRDVWANATVSNQLRRFADRLKPYLQSAAVAPGGWLAPLKESS